MVQPEPVAIVISGLPCSGKSTLAAYLQTRCRLPLLAKDAIKESLFDSLGFSDRDWSRRISIAAYALLFTQAKALLDCGQSVILEANFRADQHAVEFAGLAASTMRFAQIHCRADAAVLVHRYRERLVAGAKQRHPGHVDMLAADEIEQELVSTVQLPLVLPRLQRSEVVVCDTSIDPSFAIEQAAARIVAMICE